MDDRWFFTPQFHWFNHDLTPAGLAAMASIIVGGLVLSIFILSEHARHALSRLGLDKNFVTLVTSVASIAALLAALVLGLNAGGLPIPWEQPIPGIGLSAARVMRLVILFIVVIWFSSVSKRFLFNRYLSRFGLDRSLQYALAQMAGYVVLILGLFIVLQNAGLDLSALTVFAGALGVGLGFGLQNIARNFISGLVILTERPITIGDRIEVEKIAGRVTRIRARSTTIVTNDNLAIVVPNSDFIEKPVINWTHHDPKVRFRVPVGVAYGSDIEKVTGLLLEVAREHSAALAQPEPQVFFDSFGDSSLNFELVVWSDEMSYRPRRFRSDLNYAIERKFRESGVEIPFPQRDVHVIDLPRKPEA